jgi:hypothetical protein
VTCAPRRSQPTRRGSSPAFAPPPTGLTLARRFPREISLEKTTREKKGSFDPRVGKWAAIVLREDAAAAKEALAPLLEQRTSEGVAFDETGPCPGFVVIDRPAADKPFLWEEALREAAGAPRITCFSWVARNAFHSTW